MNVTVTDTTADSHLTLYPTGMTRPMVSSLNWRAEQTVANLAMATVGGDGRIAVFNGGGSAHVIIDVVGWFANGTSYKAVPAQRILDSRPGELDSDQVNGPVVGGQTLNFRVLGRPPIPANAVATVVLHVTVVNPTQAGWLQVHPTARPPAIPTSNVNFVAGQHVSNLVFAEVGADGQVAFFTPHGSLDLIVDVFGYFEMPATGSASPALGAATTTRRSFVDQYGRYVMFAKDPATNALTYQVSAEGTHWTAPRHVATLASGSDFAATPFEDRFYLAYYSAAASRMKVTWLQLPTPWTGETVGGWDVPETGTALPTQFAVTVTRTGGAVDVFAGRNRGPLDRFVTFHRTEGGVGEWIGPTVCDTNNGTGILVNQLGRLLCITQAASASLRWTDWAAPSWQPASNMPVATGPDAPSFAVAPDGTVHVVAAGPDGVIRHTRLGAASSQWTAPVVVGQGAMPKVEYTSSGMVVVAKETITSRRQAARIFTSTDGTSWFYGGALGGEMAWVIDSNENWPLVDHADGRDLLFKLSGPAGVIGNQAGTNTRSQFLTDGGKRVAFRFDYPASAQATAVRLKARGVGSTPSYRVGIQPAAGGVPSGHWLHEVAVGGTVVSGSYGSFQPPATATPASYDVALGTAANIAAGTHFVVIEYEPRLGQPAPTSANYLEVSAVEGEDPARPGLQVFERTGATWQRRFGELPLFTVLNGSSPVLQQQVAPAASQPVGKRAVAAQHVFVPSNVTIDSASVFVTRQNVPGEPEDTLLTMTLLDGSSVVGEWVLPSVPGISAAQWVTVPTGALALVGGRRYTLVVHARSAYYSTLTNPPTAWAIGASGSSLESWDGGRSTALGGSAKAGVNDVTREAEALVGEPPGFQAFDAGSGDAVYVGVQRPYTGIAMRSNAGPARQVTIDYWNGTTWQAVTPMTNTLGASGGGAARFATPQDWQKTELDGVTAFWSRLRSPGGGLGVRSIDTVMGVSDAVLFGDQSLAATSVWSEADGHTDAAALSPLISLTAGEWNRDAVFGISDDATSAVDPPTVRADYDPGRPSSAVIGSAVGGRVSALAADGYSMVGTDGRRFSAKLVGAAASLGIAINDGASLLFNDVYPDTDLVVRAAADGFTSFLIARSPAAPERFNLVFTNELGPMTVALAQGELRSSDGALAAGLPPAWARDGVGTTRSVAASSPGGGQLTVDVPHRSGPTTYPIVIAPDPTARVDHVYLQANGQPVSSEFVTKVRGYLQPSSVLRGYPCFAGDGASLVAESPQSKFQPECTAHAHAVRKLNQLVRGKAGDFAPVPEVQWEMGPRGEDPCVTTQRNNPNCDAETVETEETLDKAKSDSARWRIDIVVEERGAPNPLYGLFEVKQYNAANPQATFNQVNGELAVYERNVAWRNIATRRSRKLQPVYSYGWAVEYFQDCLVRNSSATRWFAWVPGRVDAPFQFHTEEQLAGHVYFARAGELTEDPRTYRYVEWGDKAYQYDCNAGGRGIPRPPNLKFPNPKPPRPNPTV